MESYSGSSFLVSGSYTKNLLAETARVRPSSSESNGESMDAAIARHQRRELAS
jgi:hypothetical protein